MTTLKVTVDNKKNARLLTRFLRNMNFVKKIEEENSVVKDQYTNLEKIFNSIEPNDLFSGVKEPVKWQKKIRDEWETR
jgi:predicted AAA+ superfamily ATPase